MIMIYQIEVDETTGPQILGEMLEKYRIMPTFMAETKMDRETLCQLAHKNTPESKPTISMSKYAHLKIVSKAV